MLRDFKISIKEEAAFLWILMDPGEIVGFN
jgi:hypothetical protein